jgi:uncharacterized protein
MSTGPERFGLEENFIDDMKDIFARFPVINKVLLYGSRAREDFKPSSDIDLAVQAPDMKFEDFLALKAELENLPLIFKIDLLHLDGLDKAALKEKIDREAVIFYRQENGAKKRSN